MLANKNGNNDFFGLLFLKKNSILIQSNTHCVRRLNSSGKFYLDQNKMGRNLSHIFLQDCTRIILISYLKNM